MIQQQFFQYYAMPKQMLKDNTLTSNDKLVYVHLLEVAGSDFNGTLSQREMAKELGMSPTTLNKSIMKLKGRGFITIKRDNPNLSAIYVIEPLPYDTDVQNTLTVHETADLGDVPSGGATKTVTPKSGIPKSVTPTHYKEPNIVKTKKTNNEVSSNLVMGKRVEDLNANDLCKMWTTRYFGRFGTMYGQITGKERGLMKRLITEYSQDVVVKMIKYTIDEETIISGYPNISALYGFRRTLATECQKGKGGVAKKKAVGDRQYKGDRWSEDEGF